MPYIPTVNRSGDVEVDTASLGNPEKHGDLECRRNQGNDQVSEWEKRPGDGRREKLSLCARFTINDHAQAREHRVQGNEKPDRPGCDEGFVGDRRVECRLERGCDYKCEEDRGDERDKQLPRPPNRKLEAAACERREWCEQMTIDGGPRKGDLLTDCCHGFGSTPYSCAPAVRLPPVRRR
jgi:hypothetical protein